MANLIKFYYLHRSWNLFEWHYFMTVIWYFWQRGLKGISFFGRQSDLGCIGRWQAWWGLGSVVQEIRRNSGTKPPPLPGSSLGRIPVKKPCRCHEDHLYKKAQLKKKTSPVLALLKSPEIQWGLSIHNTSKTKIHHQTNC